MWVIAFGLDSYKTNEMQATTAKSLRVWKCLCKSYRRTESQYGYTLCLNSYNVPFVKFHRFPGGLKLFCNINRNLLIKLIARRLCKLRKFFLFFLITENQTIFQGISNSAVLFAFACKTLSALAITCNQPQTERALGISQDLAVSNKRGFSPYLKRS